MSRHEPGGRWWLVAAGGRWWPLVAGGPCV